MMRTSRNRLRIRVPLRWLRRFQFGPRNRNRARQRVQDRGRDLEPDLDSQEDALSYQLVLWNRGLSLFAQQQYHDGLIVFVVCHQLAQVREDHVGAYWALWILRLTIAELCKLQPSTMELSPFLGQTDGSGDDEVERRPSQLAEIYEFLFGRISAWNLVHYTKFEDEAKAWAAYYVGSTAWVFGMTKDVVTRWLKECLDLASGCALINHASSMLGDTYLILAEGREDRKRAVNFYRIQMLSASHLTNNKDAMVDALAKMSQALSMNDNLEVARAVTNKLSKLAQTSAAEDTYPRAVALKRRASLSFMVNQFPEAITSNLEAIKLLETFPTNMHDCLISYTCLGGWNSCPPHRMIKVVEFIQEAWQEVKISRDRLGEHEEALQAEENLRRILVEHAEDPVIQPILGNDIMMHNLRFEARIHLNNKNLEEAETTAAQLLKLSSNRRNSSDSAEALIILSSVLFEYQGGKLDEHGAMVMESLLLEAENLMQPKSRNFRVVLSELGGLYYRTRQWCKAVEKLGQYGQEFVDMEDKFGTYSAGRISYTNRGKEVFHCLQISLLELQPPQGKQALIWAERERARDLIYGIKNKRLPLHGASSMESLSAFDSDYDTAWEEIKLTCDSAGKDSVFLVYTLQWLGDELVNYNIISYLVHAGEELQWHKAAAPSLESWVYQIRILLDEQKGTDGESVQGCLRELYTLLVHPWSEALAEIGPKRLVIIPTEVLWLVPFAALLDPDGSFLVEKYAISYAPSLRLFKQCEEQQVHSMRQRALVVGNPDGTLDSAQKEAEFVVQKLNGIFEQVDYLSKDLQNCSAEAVLEALPSCDWVHIASHAIINKEFPHGAVLMDKLEQAMESLDFNDRAAQFNTHNVLTGEQIEASADELKTVAVVLSACSTGLGEIAAEGTLGLCRSLHAACVPTVVVSLWDVADEATKVLMELLYTELVCKGTEIVVALKRAMKQMIEMEDDWGYPQYSVYQWAAFTISGSGSTKLLQLHSQTPGLAGVKLS